jgi:hypothetical protein
MQIVWNRTRNRTQNVPRVDVGGTFFLTHAGTPLLLLLQIVDLFIISIALLKNVSLTRVTEISHANRGPGIKPGSSAVDPI